MSSTKRYVVCALFAMAALCAATASHAQSPFDGTWRVNLAQTKFSPKPLTFYLSQGWYHCTGSCNPAYDIAADGQDHAVAGHSYDTLSVTIVDDHTISAVGKKGGTVIFEQTRTVSADGKTLTVKSVDHPMNGGQPSTYESVAKRSGKAPSGVHATSGDWIIVKQSGGGDALLTTYKTSGDEITMTDPTGETYTAKFDGNDYPVRGAYGYDAVSLKKINAHTIEETDKRDGTVIDVSTMTVSANGKTLTVVDTDKLSGRVDTFTATKQ
ncbi:MAG: hypothetical protein ABR865_03925 [Terracidiphilus sp.]